MKYKRLIALALAGVMTLSMAGSVMADPTMDESASATENTYDFPTPALTEEIITKKLNINTGVTVPKDPFKFVFESEDKNAPVIDPVTIAFKGTETVEADKPLEAKASLGDLTETFSQPGKYVYTIKEEKGKNTDIIYDDKTTYEFIVYKEYNKAPYCTIKKIKDAEGNDVTEAKAAAAEFTNTYEPKAGEDGKSLVVSKAVTRPEWSKTNTYKFKLSFTNNNVSKAADIVNALVEADSSLTKDGENAVTFEIASTGEKVEKEFKNLPQGVSFTVLETSNTDDYGTNFIECDINGAKKDDKTFTETLKAETTTVDYVNIFENITVTGLALNIAPFIAMFAVVGAAIALYVAAKRRVR